ncbi:MAG TPA: FkbM family methyltransferase, partial [Gemmatimonadaceae bacterium]|nr:FkbM family methyltransferase [Gemmatimonadaceae bacterium]
NTLRFITGHPLNAGRPFRAAGRFISWQVRSRLASGPLIVDFVEGTKLLVSRGQTGATGNIYTGLHELPEMSFALHFLRPDDLFIDIGANVGTYTIIAAGACGARCISFEPGQSAFDALKANARLNELESRVDARQSAVGERNGWTSFTASGDTLAHVASDDDRQPMTRVAITTLDDAISGQHPVLAKIDVEGYEGPVVAGAPRTLADPSLLAVIMETNDSGRRYSMSSGDVDATMRQLGFHSFTYDAFTRKLTESHAGSLAENSIYVRDLAAVEDRLRSARKFRIAGRRSL